MAMLRYKIYAESNRISFEKPVLVLLHGFGGGYANWYGQIRALKRDYDLLLIELPSHGKSPVKLSELENSYESVVREILRVLDHLGIEKANFGGLSMGTMFVKYMALHYPQRVDKYILAGPIGEFDLLLRGLLNLVRCLLHFVPLNWLIKVVTAVLMPHRVSKSGRELFVATAKRLSQKEYAAWLQLLTKYQNIQNAYRQAMGDEANALYLVGELDHFFLPMLKKERKTAKNFVLLEDAGHVCVTDQAELANQQILAFLNG